MKTIAILGVTGMLGYTVLRAFAFEPNKYKVIAFARDLEKAKRILLPKGHNVEFRRFDHIWLGSPKQYDYIINCVGKIKPYLKNEDYKEIVEAVEVNIRFPHKLAAHFCDHGVKILQIATDCAFSTKGPYNEKSIQNPEDVYGKTKSLGEVKYPNFYNLRCSIIGKEFEQKLSLFEWFLSQPEGSNVNGFTNHFWNGVTTLQFARICQNIIDKKIELPNLIHVVPKNSVSKYGLLNLFKQHTNKQISVNASGTAQVVDRTLSTIYSDQNELLWGDSVLTIEKMIEEYMVFESIYKYVCEQTETKPFDASITLGQLNLPITI
jgi:dTDP-4-dehydrorhamnose reductase